MPPYQNGAAEGVDEFDRGCTVLAVDEDHRRHCFLLFDGAIRPTPILFASFNERPTLQVVVVTIA